MRNHDELESLALKFDRHADEEGAILTKYRALAEGLGDSAAGMLVNQILTDEEVHHLLLRTMASWLREQEAAAQGTATRAMQLPEHADRAELLRLTRLLQEHERETVVACRRLRPRRLTALAVFLATLLEAMALDSEKHAKLLRAIEKMLEA